MRMVYAGAIELRTDEAYYWTWSKESVLSFLDHPPMIAWFIRFGTAILRRHQFLGVRFAGVLAMLVTQLMLADMVRRVTHDVRAIVLVLLDAGSSQLLRPADGQGRAGRGADPVAVAMGVGAGAAGRKR